MTKQKILKFNLTSTQSLLIKTLNKKGGCWIVGGANRDLLLNKTPKDIDIATNLLPDKVIELVENLKLIRIPDATAYHHGITRVVDKQTGEIIDIATTRSDTRCDGRYCTPIFTNNIEEDLARRDFTINAIATEVDDQGNIINTVDPFNGIRDIQRKSIRWVGDPEKRIKEDYLRLIRIARFGCLWKDYTYEVYPYHHLVKGILTISKERIRDEIIKSLSYPFPSNFWRSMRLSGLLPIICPELATTFDCKQNVHHNYESVWDHILRTFEAICELTDKPMLKLAALFHDIGKPSTKTIDENGNVHFFKHEVESANITYEWMKEYKFSNEQCLYVSKIINNHQWRFEQKVKTKTIKKWLQKVGKDVWEDLITLRCADRKGNITKQNHPMMTKEIWDLYNKAKEIINTKQPLFREDLAINGDDIKALGIKPGPKYKEMFGNLLAIVIADPNKNNKEFLINYILQHKKRFSNG